MKHEHEVMLETIKSRCVLIAEAEEHRPAVFVRDTDGETHVTMLVGTAKPQWPEVISSLANSLRGEFVVFVTEGWGASAQGPEDTKRLMERAKELGGVGNLPLDDRFEMLVVQYQERGENSKVHCETAVIDTKPYGRKCREWVKGAVQKGGWIQDD